MVYCTVWLRDLDNTKIGTEVFGKLRNVMLDKMERIKWSEKLTNEKVLERIGEKRTLINNNLCRKANLIDHILRRNCLLRDVIGGQMT